MHPLSSIKSIWEWDIWNLAIVEPAPSQGANKQSLVSDSLKAGGNKPAGLKPIMSFWEKKIYG